MIEPYRLPDGFLSRLARGDPDVDGGRLLRSSRSSRTLQMILLILDSAFGRDAGAGYEVLAAAHRRDPDRVDAILAHPWAGAWAAVTARAALGAASAAGPPPDPVHLNALALVAAAVTGLDAELPVRVRAGTAVLPGRGAFRLPAGHRGTAACVASGGRLHLPDGVWRATPALRSEHAGLRLSAQLEDADPYRACHGLETDGPHDAAQVAGWQRLLDAAWPLLATHLPAFAEELAAHIPSLVAVPEHLYGVGHSVTSPDAYGGFALTRPPTGPAFAATFVHEFQHSRLNAIIDIEPLWDKQETRHYFAPWRADPRPLGGLFHGCFSFLHVCGYWAALAESQPERRGAPAHFARLREEVRRGLAQLWRARGLTAAGRDFVDAMVERFGEIEAVPVPTRLLALAQLHMSRVEDAWRQRNGALPAWSG